MRNLTILIIAIAFIMVAGIAMNSQAVEKGNPFKLSLSSDEYNACGLSKLTDSEAERLFSMISSAPAESYLRETALNYMRKKGWRRIQVLGITKNEESVMDEDLLMILDKYAIVLLDAWHNDDTYLDPGIYWAKNSLSSWDIVFPDGTEHDFHQVNN